MDGREFRGLVDDLKRDFESMATASKDQWLGRLYERYSDRFRSDNERIWSTGAILIPVALGASAALAVIAHPRMEHIAVLGGVSSTLMFVWLVIAENHRSFQQRSEAWLVAVEETIGIHRSAKQKVSSNRWNRLLTFPSAVQLRWALFIVTVAGWVAVAIAKANGGFR